MNQNEDFLNELKSRKIDTPDAEYFNNMSQSIIDQNSKNIFSKKKFLSIAAIAASVIIFLLVYPSSVNNPSNLQIDAIEISSYIDANIDEFSEELIIESLESTNDLFETTVKKTDETTTFLEQIDNDEILDYLIEEDFDTDDLLI